MQVARGGVSLALAVLLSMAGVQSQEVSSSRWPELIRQAESDLSAERIPESANARRLAEVNLRALDSFLATSPTHGARFSSSIRRWNRSGERCRTSNCSTTLRSAFDRITQAWNWGYSFRPGMRWPSTSVPSALRPTRKGAC